MHCHPPRNRLDDGALVVVDRAIAADRNVQEQVAVLADDVHEQLDHGVGTLVRMSLEEVAVVVPVADACIGLPWQGLERFAESALVVLHERMTMLRRKMLRVEHCLQRSPIRRHVRVVVPRGDIKARLAEGKFDVVEVDQVGRVFRDQLLAARIPLPRI